MGSWCRSPGCGRCFALVRATVSQGSAQGTARNPCPVIRRWEPRGLVYNKAAPRCPCRTQRGSIARSFTGEISFRKKNLSFPGVLFHPRHDMLFSETGRAQKPPPVSNTPRGSLCSQVSATQRAAGRAKVRAGGGGRVAPILRVGEAGEQGLTCTWGGADVCRGWGWGVLRQRIPKECRASGAMQSSIAV